MSTNKTSTTEKPATLSKFWASAIAASVVATVGGVTASHILMSLLKAQEQKTSREEARSAVLTMIQSSCVQEVMQLAMPQAALKSDFAKIDSDENYYSANHEIKKAIKPKISEVIYTNSYSPHIISGQPHPATAYFNITVQSDFGILTNEDLALTVDMQGNVRIERDDFGPAVRYPEPHIVDYEKNVKARGAIIKANYPACIQRTYKASLIPE